MGFECQHPFFWHWHLGKLLLVQFPYLWNANDNKVPFLQGCYKSKYEEVFISVAGTY